MGSVHKGVNDPVTEEILTALKIAKENLDAIERGEREPMPCFRYAIDEDNYKGIQGELKQKRLERFEYR